MGQNSSFLVSLKSEDPPRFSKAVVTSQNMISRSCLCLIVSTIKIPTAGLPQPYFGQLLKNCLFWCVNGTSFLILQILQYEILNYFTKSLVLVLLHYPLCKSHNHLPCPLGLLIIFFPLTEWNVKMLPCSSMHFRNIFGHFIGDQIQRKIMPPSVPKSFATFFKIHQYLFQNSPKIRINV